MRKLTLVCAILGLSMGFVACSDDDDSSSSDKVAVGGKCKVAAECQSNVCENGVCVAKATDADACKDKNEGDKCGEGMICDAQKKCVADLRECSKDEDCSAAFPKCDTEANLCYKVNADYQINCSNAGDKKTAYMAEWIYKDNSKESKIISEECTGEKSDCKEGVGCAVPTTAQERECYYQEDCQNKGERTLCGPDYMCIKPECSTESPCTDSTKECKDGLCVSKSA